MRRTRFTTIAAATAAITITAMSTGCGDDETVQQPDSMRAPVSVAVAQGEVCLPDIIREDATFSAQPLPSCADGGNGFGLVANQRRDSVGVVALGQQPHRVANIDNRRPGITHIDVGARPVDVAVSGDGTAAISADQADRTLTGIDLWTLRTLGDSIELEGTPKAVETLQGEDGQWLAGVLTIGPDRLEVHGAPVCERPDVDDRRRHDPADNCQFEDVDADTIELPGRPVDMTVDAPNHRGWVIYRDLNELSWIAFDDRGLDEDEECLDGGGTPCEVARVGWEENQDPATPSARWGATAVDVDPLGMFVYVLDRPNNQLLVFDRQRRQLINAAEAMEPPLAPLERTPGIALLRSAMALAADVDRQIIDDGHVSYQLGARVAADNGQLYRVGALDVECQFDGDEPLSDDEFFFDADAREQSAEAACLRQLPQLPLGGDPDFEDDEELLERRVVEEDGVSVAITPVFGLRDVDGRDGDIIQPLCDQPAEFRDRLMDADTGEGIGCGSPLAPQPVGLDVEEDLDSYDDEPRADLMTFARMIFDDGQAVIDRSVYDARMFNEEWSVTYEGPLPAPGASAAGLVDDDEEGLFLSGGAEYCSAGVEVGDRLTIVDEPADRAGCEVFEGDASVDRTWEITAVTPFEVELAVVDNDDDFVDELPTRECFDQGLDYEIRPHDAWTVVGDRSGLISPWRRDGDQCVLREGADEERSRIQSRVGTGEMFVGPYLRFRIREGEVQPVSDLEYTFRTRRRFSVDAMSHVPDPRRGSPVTMPSQVVFTPDLGAGRLLTVVDPGGDRLFVHNVDGVVGDQFVR